MIIYEVIGNPVPWAASKTNGKMHYDPKHKEKLQTIWQLKPQITHQPIAGPVNLHILFNMSIPKSTSGIRRRQMVAGLIHHISKPDRTNLLKFIEDCLERAGILTNDSIVVGGDVRKVYGITPKTVIRIERLNDMGGKNENRL